MLENMRAFVTAAESESFSEAGRRLRASANVVSHRIQMLEKHLGCRLFNRTRARAYGTARVCHRSPRTSASSSARRSASAGRSPHSATRRS